MIIVVILFIIITEVGKHVYYIEYIVEDDHSLFFNNS